MNPVKFVLHLRQNHGQLTIHRNSGHGQETAYAIEDRIIFNIHTDRIFSMTLYREQREVRHWQKHLSTGENLTEALSIIQNFCQEII